MTKNAPRFELSRASSKMSPSKRKTKTRRKVAKKKAAKKRPARRRNPVDKGAGTLEAYVAKLDGASRSTVETMLDVAKDNATDLALPASRRKIWKALIPILRAQLKDFGPKRNPQPRQVTKKRYRAKVKCPGTGRLVTREFNAANDAAALRYANGLMLSKLPKGSRPQSLKAVAAAAKKKTR